RRAFTLPEIKRILKACGDDQEWRGLILFGLYLGQRLGDLAKFTWRTVDLDAGTIAFTTDRTTDDCQRGEAQDIAERKNYSACKSYPQSEPPFINNPPRAGR